MRRHALPALAAVAIVIGGPHRERFDVIHAPRLVLLLVLGAALLAVGRLPRSQWRFADWAFAAVVLLAMLSGLFASSPAYALTPVALLVACLALAAGTAWRDDRDLWLAWLGAAAIAVAAIGMLEAMGFGPASLYGRAPSGTMGQRNTLAHFLVLASPVVWTLALRARSPGARSAWILGAALMAAVVVQTRCRAAWVVAPIALVAFAVLARSVKVLAVGAAAAISAAFPVGLAWKASHPYLNTLGRLVDSRSGSGAGRLEEWAASLALFVAHPLLGAGPGHWFVEYGVGRGADHFAHSDWVALLVERGSAGTLAVIALAAGVLSAWRRRSDFALVAITLATAAGLGVFDSVTQLPAPAAWVTLVGFIGIRPAASARSPWSSAVVAAIALAAALMCASRLLSTADSTPFDRLERAAELDPFDAEVRLTLAEAWISAGHCERAAPHLEAAQRLLSRHPALPGLMAACQRPH